LGTLFLIPTYLHSQNDRLRASFVCRHWRRTFLRHARLWSELTLSKGENYVKTLLERTKQSLLDVIIDSAPVNAITLLSSNTIRIRSLSLFFNKWVDIQKISDIICGPLPLLHALTINSTMEDGLQGFDDLAPPSRPLFGDATNLTALRLYSPSGWLPLLNHVVFRNPASFDLVVTGGAGGFRVSGLLDFLEASQTLRKVSVMILWGISLDGIPKERVVSLPNAEEISLVMTDGAPGYQIAAHMSCPSARNTTLVHEKMANDPIPDDIFPNFACWSAIVRQHTRSPVEGVTLQITSYDGVTCKLTFLSPDASVLELRSTLDTDDEDGDEGPIEDFYDEALIQATQAIRNYPQLTNLKRLRICHGYHSDYVSHVVNEIGRVFKSLGPLDELTIYDSDLQPYLHPFLDLPETSIHGIVNPIVFPPVKELTISHPLKLADREGTAIAELAKSHHTRGTPFERVVIRGERMPVGMEEELRPWVGNVEHCYEPGDTEDD
jgi:hypothetical protein